MRLLLLTMAIIACFACSDAAIEMLSEGPIGEASAQGGTLVECIDGVAQIELSEPGVTQFERCLFHEPSGHSLCVVGVAMWIEGTGQSYIFCDKALSVTVFN